MEHRITANGVAYIAHDLLGFSDYSNGGSVARANVRDVLKLADIEESKAPWVGYSDLQYGRDPMAGTFESYKGIPEFWGTANVIMAYGGYGTTQALLREDWEETESILAALADYPVLDEMTIQEVESEMESEAWESWIASDLRSETAKLCEDESESDFISYDLEDDELRNAYHAAQEQCNEYGHVDGDSWWVDVSKLARAALEYVREHKTEG